MGANRTGRRGAVLSGPLRSVVDRGEGIDPAGEDVVPGEPRSCVLSRDRRPGRSPGWPRASIAMAMRSAPAVARTTSPPSPTTSRTAPTSVATAGMPHNAASMRAPGIPSVALVEMITSAAWRIEQTSSRRPSRRTWPALSAARCWRASRSGPSPTTSSCAFGTRRTASRARPTRFSRGQRADRHHGERIVVEPVYRSGCLAFGRRRRGEHAVVAGVGDHGDPRRRDTVQAGDRLGGSGPQRDHVGAATHQHAGARPWTRPRTQAAGSPMLR